MRKVYFETDEAILRFRYEDVIERLPCYESAIGAVEATALRDLLARSD